jgi:hypothetical protein
MQAVADGALLLSAWVELKLPQHHCQTKDWRYSQAAIQVCYSCFRVGGVAWCMCCGLGKGGGVTWWFEGGLLLPLLIVDVFVQAVLVTPPLWTFSMRLVDNGALLFSAWLEVLLLRHRCRTKDWRYSQVAGQVCYSCFTVDGVACMF